MGNYYSPYSLRVCEELLYKVKYIAEIYKRSANRQMEQILEEYVCEWEKQNGEIEIPADI